MVRLGTPDDVEAILDLDPLLDDHQHGSPVFLRGAERQSRDELRAEVLEDLANEEESASRPPEGASERAKSKPAKAPIGSAKAAAEAKPAKPPIGSPAEADD